MARDTSLRLQIKINFTDAGETPELRAYAFSSGGQLLGSAPVEKAAAEIAIPAEQDGRRIEVILGPPLQKGQTEPTAASLKRAGGYQIGTRFLSKEPRLELNVPSLIFPHWCICLVRGRLVKRVTLPDGTVAEYPVCHARVHICEVDRLPWIIAKLPDPEILRLREDLLDKLRVVPKPFPFPEPPPRLMPIAMREHAEHALAHPAPVPRESEVRALAQPMQTMDAQTAIASITTYHSIDHLRRKLVDLSSLIVIHLCDLHWLWYRLRCDDLATVDVDNEGRFSRVIFHDCNDQPDLYFWVEQFHEGAWHTVYRPSLGCGTYWNYVCGTDIVLNLPNAVGCEPPPVDIPSGVTLFVMPWSIGNAPIWGIPSGAPTAPDGWVRSDGNINYHSGSSLGWLYNAPFARTLNFIQDDSWFIPDNVDIKFYRYSYRRLNATPNTGASDPTWAPIVTPLWRSYRIEYSDRLPTYESYPIGPETHGANTGLFKFKPQTPPARPSDPATAVVREWLHGNLGEAAAAWDTMLPAPPLSDSNITDDAGDFEVKIEVFNAAGALVMPGAATFRFLARNADGTTARLATAVEEVAGAYVLRVHVDNNGASADLPQPSVNGVAASDDCGFLRYDTGDQVRIRYLAAHPNQHAVFGFGVMRGSNGLALASTTAPYVEVAAANAPTTTTPYAKTAGYYQRDFTPAELVGTCVNAAFAANLYVYGKATNGYYRLGLDAARQIAFALAEQEHGHGHDH